MLRGLDYLYDTGHDPTDDRVGEALDVVKRKGRRNGRWRLDHVWEGANAVEMEREGQPSRWITLRALRVLGWFVQGTSQPQPGATVAAASPGGVPFDP